MTTNQELKGIFSDTYHEMKVKAQELELASNNSDLLEQTTDFDLVYSKGVVKLTLGDLVHQTIKQDRDLVELITEAEAMCSGKHDEYATDGDFFHNFNSAAGFAGITPQEALMGFVLKHVVSFFDMADGLIELNETKIKDVYLDIINYMVILKVMNQVN